MNIADRIQSLRKIKGISQEELASKIGVSRQAVSKWESEQSVPDIEKIIIMSDFFEVTTDYILKGIETKQMSEKQIDSKALTIVGSFLNFIGLIVSAAIWYEKQNAIALVVGIVFMALGCMVFYVGLLNTDNITKQRMNYYFWRVNIWILSFIPLSFIYNMVMQQGSSAPYPLMVSPIISYFIFWVLYIGICLLVNFYLKSKKNY